MNIAGADVLTLQEKLIHLHQLESRVRGMSSRLDAATRRLGLQKERLELLKRQHAELADQQKAARAHATTLEKQAAESDARISKLRDQMNNVTSNKEYSAMLLEVNTLKTDSGKVEEEALEQMSLADQLAERTQEAADKVTEQEKLIAGAEKDVEEARAEVGSKLDEARAERDAAAAEVPSDILALFNRLTDQYDGEAVCDIEEQDRRRMEYICFGCYMSLPVERVNALIMRPDELTTCPNCQRMLYINAELKEAIGGVK